MPKNKTVIPSDFYRNGVFPVGTDWQKSDGGTAYGKFISGSPPKIRSRGKGAKGGGRSVSRGERICGLKGYGAARWFGGVRGEEGGGRERGCPTGVTGYCAVATDASDSDATGKTNVRFSARGYFSAKAQESPTWCALLPTAKARGGYAPTKRAPNTSAGRLRAEGVPRRTRDLAPQTARPC